MVVVFGDIEVLIVALQHAEDVSVHRSLHTVVRTEQYAVLIFD